MVFAIIGGDQRQALLCRLLIDDGHEVRTFALDRAEHSPDITEALSPGAAMAGADCVILPLPVAGQRGLLNTPLSAGEYALAEILDAVPRGALVCAGRVDPATRELAEARGIPLIDYFKREELAVQNAVATAEGALGIIMQDTAVTVWNCRILVIGFGRIGKLLAHRLRGMGADVTVSSRNWGDKAWCQAYGYHTLDTRHLEGHLGDFDVVVNTVPAPVLGEERLRELAHDALCLDLASRPGGMDFVAAARLGVRAIWALSLPGEVAPRSAGAIIRDTIYNIIDEQERES